MNIEFLRNFQLLFLFVLSASLSAKKYSNANKDAVSNNKSGGVNLAA